jgi:hypothetical protein
MDKGKGDLDDYTEGKAQNEQTQMEELVSKGFGYPIRLQLKLYLG